MATNPCVYRIAWRLLALWVAKSRKQSISKADITEWKLRSIEEAVDLVEERVKQEKA